MSRFQDLSERYDFAYGSNERIQRDKALIDFKEDLVFLSKVITHGAYLTKFENKLRTLLSELPGALFLKDIETKSEALIVENGGRLESAIPQSTVNLEKQEDRVLLSVYDLCKRRNDAKVTKAFSFCQSDKRITLRFSGQGLDLGIGISQLNVNDLTPTVSGNLDLQLVPVKDITFENMIRFKKYIKPVFDVMEEAYNEYEKRCIALEDENRTVKQELKVNSFTPKYFGDIDSYIMDGDIDLMDDDIDLMDDDIEELFTEEIGDLNYEENFI